MSQKLKEVKLTPNTSEHDMSYRVDNIKKWFEKGDKVKITLTMKGREQSHGQIEAYKEGYKAGSKGKWTDEDILKAFKAGRAGKFDQNPNHGHSFSHNSGNEEDYLQSLKPTPKQVEVEMEERQFTYGGAFKAAMDNNEEMIIPKIKDNKIIVRRWIYENNI